ncbi:hypothetical protein [Pantoea agglomerans]|uniref:hypothetical protein n=1 Tax=Enterobacter agglomerans TaxID=549 RepID=UPI000DFF517E|nr:hypothetical protein [Pantoea agglomerans]SUC48991.1 Uncharacterised protein [Pantoea agglomerans]
MSEEVKIQSPSKVTVLSNDSTSDLRKKILTTPSPQEELDDDALEAYYLDPFTGEEIYGKSAYIVLREMDKRGIELIDKQTILQKKESDPNFSFKTDSESKEYISKINTPKYEASFNEMIDKGIIEFNDSAYFEKFIKETWNKELDKDFFVKAEKEGKIIFPYQASEEDKYQLSGVDKFIAEYRQEIDYLTKKEYIFSVIPRNREDKKNEWYQVGFGLDECKTKEEANKVADIIAKNLSHVDMHYQGKHVAGLRAVMSYGTHFDQERGWHIQLCVNSATIYHHIDENGNKHFIPQPRTNFGESKEQAAILESINAALAKENLPLVKAISSNRVDKKIDPQSNNDAREAAHKGAEMPELPQDTMNTVQAEDYYRNTIDRQIKDLAELRAKEKALNDSIQANRHAQNALTAYHSLTQSNANLSAKVEELSAKNEELENTFNEKIELIERNLSEFEEKNKTLFSENENLKVIADKVPGLEETILDKEEIISKKDSRIQRILTAANNVKVALKREIALLKDKLFNTETQRDELKIIADKVPELEANVRKLNEDKSALTVAVEKYKAEADKVPGLQSSVEILTNSVDTLTQDKAKLTADVAKEITRANELDIENTRISSENKKLSTQCKDYIEENSSLSSEVSRLNSRVRSLQLDSNNKNEAIKLYEDILVSKGIINEADRITKSDEPNEPKNENKGKNPKTK